MVWPGVQGGLGSVSPRTNVHDEAWLSLYKTCSTYDVWK